MNKLLKTLSSLGALTLFITACSARTQPLEQTAPEVVTYQTVLGKSVSDKDVADFIASNKCTPTGQFQLCQSAGLALWMDVNHIIRTVYLHINNSDGSAPYQRELPDELKYHEMMEASPYKDALPDGFEFREIMEASESFAPYKGELPYGFKFYDTMEAVEYKLAKLDAAPSVQTLSKAGLPDEGSSPDYFHYWALYKRYHMIIIYNSPYADADATIYAILVSN